ncbi:RRM domain-containing protein [Fusarium sp. LHS14.1]|nr:RRM domain-containing protein [Fusarium sp. LHS14.1]
MAHRLDPAFEKAISPPSDNGPVDSFQVSPTSSQGAHAMYSTDEGTSNAAKGKGRAVDLPNGFTDASSGTATGQTRIYRHVEEDPFAGPSTIPGQFNNTGLSPMASAFQPAPIFPPRDDFLSTDLGISRLIEVSGEGVTVTVAEVGDYLTDKAKEDGVQLHGGRTLSTTESKVYVSFEDLRDAGWASTALRQRHGWKNGFLHGNMTENGYEYAGDQRLTHLGQVAIYASPPFGAAADHAQVVEVAKAILNAHGQLFGLVKQLGYTDGSFRAIGQFCKVADAINAVRTFNGVTPHGLHLEVTAPIGPKPNGGNDPAMHGLALVHVANRQQGAGGGSRAAHAPYLIPTGPASMQYGMQGMQGMQLVGPVYQAPPSPAMTSRHGANVHSPSRYRNGNHYGYNHAYHNGMLTRWDPRRQPRSNRSGRNIVNNSNHVDLQEVISGRDCRTTIMLRNIPNKVDQPMLKRFVDESSFGKYDFMYLRIDFANDCNVGYAFINFAKAEYIIPFVEHRANKRWNLFRSDKVAEVSYATIQGKDCLVQKFRNSSVMLEAEHYRPKLFYTEHCEDQQLIGREEPFPGPDNHSKMKRSCENAEHVGLFTPNAGQHYRDEQRRRRSQYDRGTRLAVLEEMHETTIGPYYARDLNMRR